MTTNAVADGNNGEDPVKKSKPKKLETKEPIPIDVVDVLVQLLSRQISLLIDEAADEIARIEGEDGLLWSSRLCTAIRDNLADKAQLAQAFADFFAEEDAKKLEATL